MAKVNLYGVTDLLWFARSIGYDWNEVYSLFLKYNIRPMYEIRKHTFYPEDFYECENEDLKKIMLEFFKEENVEEITIIDE
jgi:hypothetical protein